jgi:SAM-dependent methyltransferase
MTRDSAALLEISLARSAVAALDAADTLGVLDALSSQPGGSVELVERCGISANGARVLLNALEGLGLLEPRNGDGFVISPRTVAVLRKSRMDSLAEVIRGGRSRVGGDTTPGAADFYPDVVEELGDIYAYLARKAAELIEPVGSTVLDLGAGAAPWSIGLAQRRPNLQVTAVDLPEIVPATDHAVNAAGLTNRFRIVGGDMFSTEIPGQFDLVLLGNICHLFDPERNKQLLARVHAMLAPNGTVALLDILPSDDPAAYRSVALYELSLLTRSASGQVYRKDTFQEWLTDAGFSAPRFHLLGGTPPITLIQAARTT